MAISISLRRTPIAVAALVLATSSHAQTAATLSRVTVTGKGEPAATIGGWGDTPLWSSPFQASIMGREQMREMGVQRLADVVRIDPAVSDSYNAEGYWDYLTVRGYVIDNRTNYRRDGLPINAETSIPLDNKERVEILKGTSGLQAGVSAPGGLVNFVVKRPTMESRREVQLGWRQSGSLLGAVDISQRFGVDQAFGLRVNAAAERIDPRVRSARGDRQLLAVAGDWRLGNDSLLEAEFETSHRKQPSVPGFSMLGNVVPAPVDPRINLNNQPWSLPVVFDANTGSIRFSQRLSEQWRWTAHAATQRLRTDDRIAFPFGCFAENPDYIPPLRYCSDGTFDLYDFRSENERRRTDVFELALHGSVQTGAIAHTLSAGLLRSKFRARFQPQAFNFAGTGNVQGTLVTPEAPLPLAPSTNRDERSTELFVRDAVRFDPATTAWLGLRHTRLSRESVDTDGNVAPSDSKSFTTPWVALSREIGAGQLVYASWGQGVEALTVPNLSGYTQQGQPLPAQKSRQVEMGLKGHGESWNWGVAGFDIQRPVATDRFPDYVIDGTQHHRGIAADGAWQVAHWTFQGGVQFLQARREGSMDATLNGKQAVNVPARSLKLQVRHDLAALPGLSLQGNLLAESERMVVEDNSARIPGYARLDAGLRYQQTSSIGALTWRAGIDNLLDRRAWRESPLQFGHVYLFPLAPRTVRLSVEATI